MIATYKATVIDTDIFFFTIYDNMNIGMRQAHCDMYIFLIKLNPQIIRALADNYS